MISLNEFLVKGKVDVDKTQYVDLDLTSGTLWASCNIGAETPEEAGEYYSWGELNEKNVYTWDNYKFGKSENSIKYNENDKLYTLENKDDVANKKLKYDWCIPTIEQCKELIKNTKQQIAEINGKKGTLFTSLKNEENYIFIPFGGYKRKSFRELNETGEIWANDLCIKNDELKNRMSGFEPYNMANVIYIADNINKAEIYQESRYMGLNIRPVKQ